MRTNAAVSTLSPLLGIFLFALACADPVESVSSEPSLVIAPANQTLQVPRTLQVTTGGGLGAVTWGSSNEAVATVSATGLVAAVFPGSATITARRGSQSAVMALTVTASRIDLGPTPVIVSINGTVSMTAIVRDAEGAVLSGVEIGWHSGNASIATVGLTSGVVTGVSPGNTIIAATGGGTSGEAAVLVHVTFGARLAFSSIGTASNYICGLEAQTGRAYCWGDNHSGALGVGDTYAGPTDFPLLVSGGLRFSSLSVGFYANCGIAAGTGLAYCWGSNTHGQLGDGSFEIRSVPTKVAGGIQFSSISSSADFTCGIEVYTDLPYCWGKGGLLGDGTLSQRSTPTLVGSGALRIRTISAGGDLACGVESPSGLGYCWGSNKFGQLGDGTRTDRLVPTLVGGGRLRFSVIDAGVEDACGIEAQSGLGYCWGSNRFGQVGDGTAMDRLEPTLVDGGSRRFSSIDPWWEGACGIEAETNAAYCWGRNHLGQLGDGTTIDRLVPTLVGGGSPRFTSISVSGFDTCGVEAQSGLGYCWGYGQLVPALISPPLSPARASGATSVAGPR